LCDLLPRLPTRTRVVLLLHQLELHKTSNTGQLALSCLPNSELVVRGGPDPLERDWSRESQAVLLFPHADAQPLAQWRDAEQPVTLVVPDGTWSQAVKARRRVPGLLALPCAFLPPAAPSRYRLRVDPRAGHISTLEAIARALELLEVDGSAVREQLEFLQQIMVERSLWATGRLPTHLVTGGIPAGAQAHDPYSGPGAARSPRG